MGDKDNTNTATNGNGKGGTLDVSNLLVWGDLGAAAAVAAIEAALGKKPTWSEAAIATAISVVSRIVTSNFTNFSSLGGNIESEETKDAFIVALTNALVAMSMKRSVARAIAVGVAADVLSDRVLDMVKTDLSKQAIFKGKDK